MTTPLLPCKKCGGPAKCLSTGRTRGEYDAKVGGFTSKPGTWVVFCNDTPNCAIGPHKETEEAAREAWNRECGRAAPEDSYATVGHAVHRGLDTRTTPTEPAEKLRVAIGLLVATGQLDVGIANELRDAIRELQTPVGLTTKDYQDEIDILCKSRKDYQEMCALLHGALTTMQLRVCFVGTAGETRWSPVPGPPAIPDWRGPLMVAEHAKKAYADLLSRAGG